MEACISAQTDYLDICGEPEYLESIFLDYHYLAVQAGTVIVGSCGFDSVPSDMGVLFTSQELVNLGAAGICSVNKSYVSVVRLLFLRNLSSSVLEVTPVAICYYFQSFLTFPSL